MQDAEKDLEIKAGSITDLDISGPDERVYELGYLLVPTIPEENVPAAYGNLKELISTSGELISDEMPKFRELAYPMSKVISNVRSKFTTAYFGWIKFTMDTQKVLKLKEKLDLDPNIVRFLILKTVKENTIAGKKFLHSGATHRKPSKKSSDGEVAIPINKEEIDKEIEALIAP